ncbi:glycosyl transferase [Ktedonobacter sp. SOSP1-52]|uniref:macrolide family glycosyltransferase n=1 Tax=Ktedonobacter sp. SOSP1-52 TaxID=2778366 RepID=UPI0019162464|nr:macrolide family glycosyltransferase [Ktedonobacter sp. SOSP1-52]GHO65437.1 glycosyl transferase [Ktedonobacter sp. SOSP1-52]
MTKYAFVNLPLHAHINPTLPIVEELVARGDQVVYYLTEKYRSAIETTGATFHPYQSKTEQYAQNPVANMAMLMVDECLFVMPQLVPSIQAEQPDCIVYDPMCLSGRFIAQILDVPAVISRPTFVAHEQGRRFYASKGADNGAAQAFQQSIKQLCMHYSLPPFNIMDIFSHKEDLNLVYIPRSFQIDGASMGPEYLFVGPCIGARCESSAFPFEQLNQQPLIYCTLGTVYNNSPEFFRKCFAAFADVPVQVIIATGRPVEQLDLGPCPKNIIVRSYVPQSEVLQQTDVFVGHGSMTTIMEAISSGVPMVVMPQATSQEPSARRVSELGLGILLDKESVTAESLRDAALHILQNPTYRLRARQMQDDAKKAGGYQRAADALQEYVSHCNLEAETARASVRMYSF